MKVLFIAGDEFEDIELLYPFYRIIEEGFKPVIAGKERGGKIIGKHGYSVIADVSFSEVKVEDYLALVIPGGRGPEKIRTLPEVKEITRKFFELKKPVAAICHGPQILISAGVVKGRKMTSVSSIKDDVIAAGGEYVDAPVVEDENLISSRHPGDLPFFASSLIKMLKGKKM
ncbi:type 1 glutamine amidotransferase domain-containing protein [Acidianus sp. HS-5]|uniref:type 1 glutamine amidotransferase domain-containing protein n=1 Tax=Acidianus sp. HS-5 TaxID=2886040 RepID=UPI001F3EE954|nr:type 1 glutamine amidotransferase domain-containing protein [Acidianus sp. HS-5]BDC18702.1 glutamine amidotransferase [Acidianus sp. HS-5]